MKVRRLRAAVPSGGGMGVRGRELDRSACLELCLCWLAPGSY